MQSLGILTAALLAVKSSLGTWDMSLTCGYPSGKNHCLVAVRQRFVLLSCSLMSLSGGRFIPQESHFFRNPLRFMLTPCTISWLFGKWKRTEGFTTSSIFTRKDKSEYDTNCEWLWSHLYLHCCSCASDMLCFVYMHFAQTRDREWHQWKCIFSLVHLCTFVYCVTNKMSHHFISWVHFIIHYMCIVHWMHECSAPRNPIVLGHTSQGAGIGLMVEFHKKPATGWWREQ